LQQEKPSEWCKHGFFRSIIFLKKMAVCAFTQEWPIVNFYTHKENNHGKRNFVAVTAINKISFSNQLLERSQLMQTEIEILESRENPMILWTNN
jgi:hypothetical protein